MFVWGPVNEFSVSGKGKFPVDVSRKVRGMFADVLNSCVLNELTPVSGRLLALVKHKWPFPVKGGVESFYGHF